MMRNMPHLTEFEFGRLVGSYWTKDLIVLGDYSNTQYKNQGTDLLCAKAQVDLLQWLGALKSQKSQAKILFEGDLFFNESVFGFLQDAGITHRGVVLDISEKERELRGRARGHMLSHEIVVHRRNRIELLLAKKMINRVFHETPSDTNYLLDSVEMYFGL